MKLNIGQTKDADKTKQNKTKQTKKIRQKHQE